MASENWLSNLASIAAVVTTAATLVLGFVQWRETRRIEAAAPFLAQRLKLYSEATSVAASLATADSPTEREAKTLRFWELYWGEMGLVEDESVERAMVAMGKAVESGDRTRMRSSSLQLAHACRRSLGEAWRLDVWLGGSDPERQQQ